MKKLNQAGFHVLPVLLGLIVISGVGFAGYRVMNNQNETKSNNNTQESRRDNGSQSSFADQYKDVCKDRKVDFTSPPIALSKMGHIEPLGKVSDGHVTPTDHVYVSPLSMNAADNTTEVLMPADGTIVDVGAMPAQYIGDRNQQTAPEDHRLTISHSCRYFSIFIHVHQLSPALKSAVGNLQPNRSKRVAVELKAGDVVGKIGGNPVDWTPLDTSQTLKGFINPKLYVGEPWKVHTISPFDLYKGNLKKQLEEKSVRTVEPLGGRIDYDQKGKLIGNWFRSGSGGYSGQQSNNEGRYWDGHLSIAPDYIDGKSTIVSIGNWQGTAKQLAAKGGIDPAKITAKDGVVKVEVAAISYNTANGSPWFGGSVQKGMTVNSAGPTLGTILLQVENGEKLKVEKFPGKAAAQVSGFTSAAQTYER